MFPLGHHRTDEFLVVGTGGGLEVENIPLAVENAAADVAAMDSNADPPDSLPPLVGDSVAFSQISYPSAFSHGRKFDLHR